MGDIPTIIFSEIISITFEFEFVLNFDFHNTYFKVVHALLRFLMNFYEIWTMLLILYLKFTLQKLA